MTIFRMTSFHPANSPLSPDAAATLDMYFLSAGMGCNPYLLRQGAEARFARLHALPACALASMGLSRATLADHVFGGLLSLPEKGPFDD